MRIKYNIFYLLKGKSCYEEFGSAYGRAVDICVYDSKPHCSP